MGELGMAWVAPICAASNFLLKNVSACAQCISSSTMGVVLAFFMIVFLRSKEEKSSLEADRSCRQSLPYCLELFGVVVAGFRNMAWVRCWFRCGIAGGMLFLCLRWQWIVLSRLGVALLSFVLVSWCVVCFLLKPDPMFTFAAQKEPKLWSFQSIPLLINSVNLKRDGVRICLGTDVGRWSIEGSLTPLSFRYRVNYIG